MERVDVERLKPLERLFTHTFSDAPLGVSAIASRRALLPSDLGWRLRPNYLTRPGTDLPSVDTLLAQ
jgi:hypothetical protein